MQPKISYLSISDHLCTKIKTAFDTYANSFRNSDPVYNRHIELKQFHTAKVCHEILDIGNSLGMTEKELNFAEVIAWLHDIGRFEQYHHYRTFSDAESENHAEIGIRVIEKEKLLSEFPANLQTIIHQAIRNHNVPRVPECALPEIDFYSRLLRDADKIDIWRVALELNIFHKIRDEKLPGTYKVPSELINNFQYGSIITLDQVDSFFDSILFRVSWIYDINFSRTFEIIRERNIINRLLQKLPSSEAVGNVGQMANSYLESRLAKPQKEITM